MTNSDPKEKPAGTSREAPSKPMSGEQDSPDTTMPEFDDWSTPEPRESRTGKKTLLWRSGW